MTSSDLNALADNLAHIAQPLLMVHEAPLSRADLVNLGCRLKHVCEDLRPIAHHYELAEALTPRLARQTEDTDDADF